MFAKNLTFQSLNIQGYYPGLEGFRVTKTQK